MVQIAATAVIPEVLQVHDLGPPLNQVWIVGEESCEFFMEDGVSHITVVPACAAKVCK